MVGHSLLSASSSHLTELCLSWRLAFLRDQVDPRPDFTSKRNFWDGVCIQEGLQYRVREAQGRQRGWVDRAWAHCPVVLTSASLPRAIR